MLRSCSRCGASGEGAGDGAPLGWAMAVEDGRVTYQCAACARENIRAIEGKLSEEWW